MRRTPRRLRAVAAILLLIAVVITAHFLIDWVKDLLELQLRPSNEHLVHRLLMWVAAAYTLLIAVPFVPGVEIAISLIMLFGAKIVLLLYLCTLAGLSLSFIAGRLVPEPLLQKFLLDLSLHRAAGFLESISAMDEKQRMDLIVSRAPRRWVPVLLRYRYLAIAVALNLPGNTLIGGGGGIVFLAGLSRLFTPPLLLVTLALAIAPVPVAVTLFGESILQGL